MSLHLTKQPLTAAEDPNLLSLLKSYYTDYIDATTESRELSNRDRDYNDHKQWSESEKQILRARKQEPVVNNVIRKKMNFLRGYERKIRTDPKAEPRNPSDEKDAAAITDALRYVADNTKFDVIRSEFWDYYLVEGVGAAELSISKNSKREIETKNIPFDRYFYDPHSRKACFSDKRYDGIVIWDDADNIKRRFPGSDDVINTAIIDHQDSEQPDKPSFWVDSQRNRVKIIQIYFIYKGLWHLAFFTASGFLKKPALSPWLDENRQPKCGIISQSPYVDREGMRFGEARFMIETQDGINKRESKMSHLLSQRQTFGNSKAFPGSVSKQKRELAKPDGHVELNGNATFGQDFGILPTGDMANGQFQLLQESKQAALSNSTASFQSAPGSENQSGRAIIANQNGQQIEINPLADGKKQWESRIYAAWWDLIRQFWTEEKWIRVTDNEQNTKFVALNKKVTVGDVLKENGTELPPEMQFDPRLNQVARIDNKVSEIDVDIIITDSPDVVSLQNEEFDKLIQLAGVGITFDQATYIKASNLRNKEELLRGIEGQNEQQQRQLQAQQEAQQQQQLANMQLQNEAVAAEVEKDGADSALKRAQAAKTQQEAVQTSIENDQLQQGIKL